MHHWRAKSVQAVRKFELPFLHTGRGVEADDTAFPGLLFGRGGEVFAFFFGIELTADNQNAIRHDGRNAGAMLVNVIGDVFVFPHGLSGVIERDCLDGRAVAPVHINARGINKRRATREGVEFVFAVRRKTFLVTPKLFSTRRIEADQGAFARARFGGDDQLVAKNHGRRPARSCLHFPDCV